jgi:hypothetical protein
VAVASWEDVGVDAAARTETGTPSAEPRSGDWPGVGLLTIGWFQFVFGVGIALTRAVRWVGGEPLDVGALPAAAHIALRGLLLLVDVRRHPLVFVLVALTAGTETALLRGPAGLRDLAWWVLIPLVWRFAPTRVRGGR